MFLEDIKPQAIKRGVRKTRSEIYTGASDRTMLPYITTTPPSPNDALSPGDRLFQHNGSNGHIEKDPSKEIIIPIKVPRITATPPTPSNPLEENKPVFYTSDKDDKTQLEELENVIKQITAGTPNDPSTYKPPPESKTSETDFVLIEITRTIAPVRSPLFSRVHLSDLDLHSDASYSSFNSLRSKTHSLAGEPKKKSYLKYLNRQISVSTPNIYFPENTSNDLDSIDDVQERRSSALFYVNDDDEEQEVCENLKLTGMLNSRRCSMQSIKSNASGRSAWTVSSGNRVKFYSRIDIVKTEPGDGAVELTEANCEEVMDAVSFCFDTEEEENNDYVQKVPHERQKMPKLLFSVIGSLLFPLFSVLIYIWDFGSDIRLALEYLREEQTTPFGLTTTCIVLPVLLMTIIDLSWLWMDRPPRPYTKTYIVRFSLGLISLGRIVRAVKHMEHLIKSKVLVSEQKRRWHHDRAMDEKRDCYMLDFINTFTESVPQLVVQLYLYYSFHLTMSKLRLLNILSSWISIGWVYAAYYRTNRQAMTGRKDVTFIGFSFFFMAVLAWLAARITCITQFLLTYNNWISVGLLFVHSVIAFLWIVFKIKPEMEGVVVSKVGRYLYYIFFSFVYNVVFLHLNSSPGKYSMIAFYFILYVENFALAGLSLYKHSETDFVDAHSMLALPLGLCLHVMFLVTFYKFFLPKALFR